MGAPRWVLCREDLELVTSDLESICRELRARLGPDMKNLEPSDAAIQWLEAAVGVVHRGERSLLPRRKQRALQEMEIVLGKYRGQCEVRGDHEDADRLRTILAAMEGGDPEVWINWDLLAERWLDLIRPVWYEGLTGRRKQSRPLLLKDVRNDLIGPKPLPLVAVFQAFLPLPMLQPLDQRLAACILGVKE
jgi:hypothetical protein